MIYLIHGADTFRSREKLNEFVAAFKAKDKGQMNLEVFNIDFGTEKLADKVKDASQSMGFFSATRMIVVKNLFSAGDIVTKEEITHYVLDMDKKKREVDFVLFEGKEIGKKGAAGGKEWSALAKKGTLFNFAPMAPGEINKWINAKFKKEGIKITPQALSKLALYVGADLWRLNAEAEKLALLKANSTFEITEQDVEELVKSDLPNNIFSTVDALAKRDKKTALRLLARHLEKGEEPIYLFTMFIYQFRNLLKVKDVMMRNKNASHRDIADQTKLNPFIVSKTMAQANGFTYEYLKKVYKRFFTFDFLIKKGRLDPEAALELLIVDIGNLS